MQSRSMSLRPSPSWQKAGRPNPLQVRCVTNRPRRLMPVAQVNPTLRAIHCNINFDIFRQIAYIATMKALGIARKCDGFTMVAVAKKKQSDARRAVTVRLPEVLLVKVEGFAEKHHRTFTSVVEFALSEYIRRYGHLPILEDSLEE